MFKTYKFRKHRMGFERLSGVLCCYNDKIQKPYFGNFGNLMNKNYTINQYLHKKNKRQLEKVMAGR